MITSLTGTIELWIAFATVCIGIGAYKLIAKQNSEQIKILGDKMDGFMTDSKMNQVKMQSNFEHMNEKQNRIESDTTVTRLQVGSLSESIATMQVRLQNIEREYHRNEIN